jgi:integrase/recombinase XerD
VRVARCVELFIQKKRDYGYKYTANAKVLRRFARFTGKLNINSVTDDHVNSFLSRTQISNNTRRIYTWHLRHLFIHWHGHRQVARVPQAQMKPATASTFVPYVYTRNEIRRLLDATSVCQRRRKCSISSETLKTLILFLFGTGTKIGEALALSDRDVDFSRGTIVVSGTTVDTRTIPIGPDVKKVLKRYLSSSDRMQFGLGHSLFLTAKGMPITYGRVCQTFNRLRKISQVNRSDSSFQPRIQDLRHSFAVHSIAKWTDDGLEIDRILPVLATYMGNVDTQGFEQYLELSPCNYQATLNRLSGRL